MNLESSRFKKANPRKVSLILTQIYEWMYIYICVHIHVMYIKVYST